MSQFIFSEVMEEMENPRDLSSDKRFLVLVPAYEPNAALKQMVRDLMDLGKNNPAFGGVVIVNDGSCRSDAIQIFDELRKLARVTVLGHDINRGKGAALKTGFSYIYNNQPDVDYVVTADADGQHSPIDVMRLSRKAIATGRPNIGSRQFAQGVPLRSRIGNVLTASVFRLATGHLISDTQSGLRTYRREDLPELLEVSADRYDYEFHCLFRLARHTDVPLQQIEIKTIYEDGNPTSHFSPIIDSIRIYAVLLRYVSVSAVSAFIDFVLFSLFTALSVSIGSALIASRIGSMPIYIYGMRNVVFQSKGKLIFQVLATVLLMAFHIVFLWQFISWLQVSFQVHPSVSMVIGMLIFYIGNFLIQKYVVYRPGLAI